MAFLPSVELCRFSIYPIVLSLTFVNACFTFSRFFLSFKIIVPATPIPAPTTTPVTAAAIGLITCLLLESTFCPFIILIPFLICSYFVYVLTVLRKLGLLHQRQKLLDYRN